jgi:hypothetical protein
MGRVDKESQLMRDGARAAQRGSSWQANPYLSRENMPPATGDTLQEWSRKHDAWQRGFEHHGNLDECKERLAPPMLVELVESRLRMIANVRAAMKQGAVLRVALPMPHARDERCRNWDLEGFECGALKVDDFAAEFRQIVDELRLRYDLV